jgi:pimeloyl-ACP methyl ester carboxylesterase
MKRTPHGLAWLALVAVLLPLPAPAASVSHLEREKGWAEQILDTLVAGEAVWLEAQGVRFLGLYSRPAAGAPSRHGLILLHGRGVHPAWGFLDTLRMDIADAGWHTLSLQMPILQPDARLAEYAKTFDEAFARIDAGIRHLERQGVKHIVLLGHSTGAMTALAYAAERPAGRVAGVVAIGPSTEPLGGRRMQPALLLEKIRVPVLDLHGSEDLPVVLDYTAVRAAAAAKAGNKHYVQVMEKGANHFFSERYDALKARVSGWLKQLRSP